MSDSRSPLAGKWKVYQSSNAAQQVLSRQADGQECQIIIRFMCGRYRIASAPHHRWKVRYQSRDRRTVCGVIDASPSEGGFKEYGFVICTGGQPGLLGIIYSCDFSDGQDPGTWEADESGRPPEPES